MDLAERLAVFKEEHPYREITVGDTAWRYRTGGASTAPAVLLLPGGTSGEQLGAGADRDTPFRGSRANDHAPLAFQASPDRLVHWLVWRTWRVLLADIGPSQQFWTSLLHSILYTDLTKPDLVTLMAAISDFTAHYRPKPGDLKGWSRQVLVLQSGRDRAFAAQADEIRTTYPSAVFQIIAGAGHGALFSHTDQILTFLAQQPTPRQPT